MLQAFLIPAWASTFRAACAQVRPITCPPLAFPRPGARGDGVRLAGTGRADADRDAPVGGESLRRSWRPGPCAARVRVNSRCVLRPCAQLRIQHVRVCAELRGAELARQARVRRALRLLAHALLHRQLAARGVPGDAGPGIDAAPIQIPDQRPGHGRPLRRLQALHPVLHAQRLVGQSAPAGPGARPGSCGRTPGPSPRPGSSSNPTGSKCSCWPARWPEPARSPAPAPPAPAFGGLVWLGVKVAGVLGDSGELAADGGVPSGGQRVPVDLRLPSPRG